MVNLYEAKTHLSALVEEASRGNEIIIAKGGKALAKLVPIAVQGGRRFRFGDMKHSIEMADDFDAPLPDEILEAFEGK